MNSIMDLLSYYPELHGSHGRVRLRLGKAVLDRICTLVEAQAPTQVHSIHVIPAGNNRFRLVSTLSNRFVNWIGHFFLHTLRESGIEIHIIQITAVPGNPFEGTLATSMIGKEAVSKIIDSINQGLEAGEVLRVKSELFGETHITLDPFPVLRKYLPAGMGNHCDLVQWETEHDSVVLSIRWNHMG
jgi:hypothetical protein